MKKFAAILLSAAVIAPLATPVMAQPAHERNEGPGERGGGHDRHDSDRRGGKGQAGGYKSFGKGDRFDSRHARNYQQVDYRKYKRLKAPPRGYRYVRSGNDVLLITAAGVVAAVTAGVFR